VNALVSAMLADSRPDIELVAQHEERKPEHCEGAMHITGRYGHVPSEPATFFAILPCRHTFLMCRGWVETEHALGICSRCEATFPGADVIYIELPTKG
jgi:hypothetical protein